MTSITTKAIVTADHKLKVELDVPANIQPGEISLTAILSQQAAPNKREAAILALHQLAETGTFADCVDPSAWQRGIRSDTSWLGKSEA